MKHILTFGLLFSIAVSVNAQIYKSKDKGVVVSFFSTTPIEDIDAKNNACSSFLNSTTDTIVFKIPNNAFVFPKSLMQEHFNENYMETPKYPYATFKGKINEDVDYTKEGTYKVTCTGMLKMHGVEQLRTIEGTVTVKGEELTILSNFNVKLADHKIDVPKLVTEKIAESILVKVNAQYTPYKKK